MTHTTIDTLTVTRRAKGGVAAARNAPAERGRMLELFLRGEITLGELEGVSKTKQYELANVGHAFLTMGKLDDARRVYEGLVVLDPWDAYFHLALGAIAQRQGRDADAERSYSRALALNVDLVPAWVNRGEVRAKLGKTTEAWADLEVALSFDPAELTADARRARRALQGLS